MLPKNRPSRSPRVGQAGTRVSGSRNGEKKKILINLSGEGGKLILLAQFFLRRLPTTRNDTALLPGVKGLATQYVMIHTVLSAACHFGRQICLVSSSLQSLKATLLSTIAPAGLSWRISVIGTAC